MSELRCATGSSTLPDGYDAGLQAARSAVLDLGGETARLVLVFTSARYDLERLLAGVREVTGDAPLAGATSAGNVVDDAYTAPGQGVGVMVLAGDRYRFGVASADGMVADPEGVGEALATRARAAALGSPAGHAGSSDALERPHAAVVLLTGALRGDGQRVLRGVHRAAGAAVPVVGGAAGDDRQMVRTAVLHDGAALADGAVGIWISSPQPLVVSSAHGWTPVSAPEVVTRAEGLVVHEIGGRPALQVYNEHGSARPRGVQLAVGEESQAVRGLGIIEPDGSHRVRGVYALPGDALGTMAAVEEYSAVQVVTADAAAVMATVEPVVRSTVAALDRAEALLVFDCVGRADILGTAVPDEAAALSAAAAGARVLGFYGYGEYARTRGAGGAHSATLCAVAL